jgi:UDP-N-acetylmuramate dehydrogenase
MIDAISFVIDTAGKRLPSLAYRLEEPMRNHTSMRIGGPVRVMFFPETDSDLTKLCDILDECKAAPLIMGNGSNLLADDKPLDIVAIKTTGLDSIEKTGETEITAGAGVLLSKLALFACECGLSGLEFAHGIPGSLGGAVFMNAGAYGGEMKDVIIETAAYSPGIGKKTVTGEEHGFSYRRSRFTDTGEVVLQSTVRLKTAGTESIRLKMDELNALRRGSQPLDIPSAGSTFKRPRSGYAAALIEQAGLKGYSFGGAQVSEKHAGFVVNRGGASFYEVMTVIEHVRETVLKQSGIELEPEVRIIMEDL